MTKCGTAAHHHHRRRVTPIIIDKNAMLKTCKRSPSSVIVIIVRVRGIPSASVWRTIEISSLAASAPRRHRPHCHPPPPLIRRRIGARCRGQRSVIVPVRHCY